MSTQLIIIDQLEKACAIMYDATQAAIKLARTQQTHATARALDDDDFIRIPTGKARCPVSRWSQSTLRRRIESGEIISKTVGKCRFYSLRSVREILSKN